mgnify:CR=1 FL=1
MVTRHLFYVFYAVGILEVVWLVFCWHLYSQRYFVSIVIEVLMGIRMALSVSIIVDILVIVIKAV